MTKTQDLKYRIGADFGELRREAQNAGTATRAFQRELNALEKKQREHRRTLEDLGRGMATFGAAVMAGLGLAAKAAIDWESAFAGVRKTVDGSDAEIAKLEGELRNLARTLPATHKEIAGVAEAAGQLGIKRDDIAGFTKVMIDLGETTNLTAEEAATALAKFSNIAGVTADDVDHLGSTLVALGNDGASTEKDIIEMGLRIAGAGRQIGLSAPQILAFGSALSSVGIEAEAGGTAISTVMVRMAKAVNDGGKDLKGFADVAGATADEFALRFKTDAAGAIIAFIQGLGEMRKSGEETFTVLEDLNLNEIRVSDTLRRASLASEVFAKSLQVGSEAWIENTALAEEAEKRYATSASKLQVAGNQIKDTLIDIGAVVAPVAAGVAQGAADIARGFQQLPGPLQDVATWAAFAAGGIGLIGGGAAIAAPKILDFRDKMRTLEDTGGAVSKGLGKLGLFLSGPWGAVIGVGVVALTAFIGSLGAASREQQEMADAGRSLADVIRDQNGAINEAVRRAAAKAAADKGILADARDLGIELPQVTNAILGQGDAYNDLKARLEGIIDANKIMQTTEFGTLEWTGALHEQGLVAKGVLDHVNALIGGKDEQLNKEKDMAVATGETTDEMQQQADETARLATESEEAAKALDGLIKAFNAMNATTLTAREAYRAYIEQLEATGEVLKKNGPGLDINTEKGRENARALDAQAKSANDLAEAAAREAEKVGGAAAGASALTASLEASRPKLIAMAEAFGLGEKEAIAYADSVLGIPAVASTELLTPGSEKALTELEKVHAKIKDVPPNKSVNVGVLSEEAIKTLTALGLKVEKLPNGEIVVTANTDPAKQNIDNFVNSNYKREILIYGRYVPPSIKEPGFGRAGMGNAFGNIVSFARGGMYENHAPQIVKAGPGTMRVWAEPDTDRESYIPWAMDRRSRATSILRTTADAFGYALVPQGRMAAQSSRGGMAVAAMGSSSIVVQAGVIGSRTELLSWLAWATDELKRRGRA